MIIIYDKYKNLKETIDTTWSKPIYIGDRKVEKVKVLKTSYNEKDYKEESIKDLKSLKKEDFFKVHWIEIIGLHDVELILEIGNIFNLHPLVIEDILNMSHGPKLEEYEDYLFLVTKNIYINNKGELETEQISFILMDDIIISFKETDREVFSNLKRRLKIRSSIRKAGGEILLYTILDTIVDDYFLVIGNISEEIDEVEDELLNNPTKELLQDIYELKRDLIYLRKILWPMRNILNSISRNDFEIIDSKTNYYFRDIYDHIIQMIDIVETYREICSGMLDIYLSSIGNKTNDVMKILTIFSTISVPLTFLTGVYGMNFVYQPELQWRYAYLVFWILSIGITIIMLKYFKDKDWI